MYGLKYYYELSRGGQVVRLNVYKRDYTGVAKVIGDFQKMNLDLQGANNDICDPIVKTSLVFTMADTADKADTATTKYGSWEEFYTPDATLFKVELTEAGSVRWTGYVTPDSWNESLSYHGSISVTARDNIGHLSDIDFNKDDLGSALKYGFMVSIANLVKKAMAKVEMPMTLITEPSGDQKMLLSSNGGVSAENWMVDIRGIESGTWFDALEKILASVGMCLRYIDDNKVILTSIRSLSLMGATQRVYQPHRSAQILNRSGVRTLDPAYKEVSETLKYNTPDDDESAWPLSAFTKKQTSKGDCWIVNGTNGWSQTQTDKMTAMPSYDVYHEYKTTDVMFRLVGVKEVTSQVSQSELVGGYIQKQFPMGTNTMAKVSFSFTHAYQYGSVKVSSKLPRGVFKYALIWETLEGNIYSYANGAWIVGTSIQDTEIVCPPDSATGTGAWFSSESQIDVDLEMKTPDVAGRMYLRIYPFTPNGTGMTDLWAIDVQNIVVGIADDALPKELRVKTIYDEEQNYKLKRDIEFGEVPTYIDHAGSVVNGLFQQGVGYPSVHRCKWSGDTNDLPLAVANHLQILAFNAKANSLLSGDLRDANGLKCVFNAIWHYANRQFLLQSGSLDLISGYFSDAILREYNDYDEVWGGAEISYKMTQGSSAVSPELVIDQMTKSGGEGEPSIVAYPTTLSFVADGETKEVDVMASAPYSIETPSWISYTVSGSRVTFTAEANGTASRSGSVRFVLNDGVTDTTVSVSQEAKQVITDTLSATRYGNPLYDYTEHSANDATAGACDVRSTKPWTASIESGSDWIEWYYGETPSGQGGTGATSIWYNIKAINTGASRQAVILVTQPSTGLTARFYINQAGGASATSLIITPSNSVNVRSDATSLDLSITSNTSWRISSSQVSMSKSSGSGNDTVTLYFNENTGASSRNLSLSIATTSGTAITRTLTIVQAGKGSTPSTYFYTDKSALNVAKTGGSSTIVLSSTSAWSASSDSAWCTVSPSSGSAGDSNSITISVGANTGNERTAQVTLTGTDGNVVVTVKQNGVGDSISLSSNSEVFSGAGEMKPVTITSSGAWSASTSADWVTISPEEGSNGSVVSITCSENGTTGRSASVVFTCGTATATYAITQNAQSLDTQLSLNPESGSVGYEGGSGTIAITSNTEWAIDNISDGLTFSVNKGEGGATVTWYATKNSGSASRSLTARFKTTNGERTKTFTITQACATISITPTSMSVGATSSSFEVAVTASGAWSVRAEGGIVSLTKQTNKVAVRVLENETVSSRTARVIFTVDGTEVSATCNITQSGAAATLSASPQNVTVDWNDVTGQIAITSNTEWNATVQTEGLTLSATHGGGGASSTIDTYPLTWTIPQNDGNIEKMYRAKFTTIDSSVSIFVTITQRGSSATISIEPSDKAVFINSSRVGHLNIESTLPWRMVCSESWLEFSPSSGDANTLYDVELRPRDMVVSEALTAILTITSGKTTEEVAVVYTNS